MVVTLDGRTTVRGTAAGLGSPTDQALMRALRAEADALLHGAETVRADRVVPRVPAALAAERVARGKPAQPAGVVVTASGRLSARQVYFRTATHEWPRYVYSQVAPLDSLEGPGVHVHVPTSGVLDLTGMLEDLARLGLTRIVCEGGPRLNAALLQQNLVDEIFVTLAPRLGGGENPVPLVAGGGALPRGVRLASAYEREGELLLRYAVKAAEA